MPKSTKPLTARKVLEDYKRLSEEDKKQVCTSIATLLAKASMERSSNQAS